MARLSVTLSYRTFFRHTHLAALVPCAMRTTPITLPDCAQTMRGYLTLRKLCSASYPYLPDYYLFIGMYHTAMVLVSQTTSVLNASSLIRIHSCAKSAECDYLYLLAARLQTRILLYPHGRLQGSRREYYLTPMFGCKVTDEDITLPLWSAARSHMRVSTTKLLYYTITITINNFRSLSAFHSRILLYLTI